MFQIHIRRYITYIQGRFVQWAQKAGVHCSLILGILTAQAPAPWASKFSRPYISEYLKNIVVDLFASVRLTFHSSSWNV
jgi:hypothetical protein